MTQSEDMTKTAAVTVTVNVQIPSALEERLAKRAKREHRSISAQVLYELERAVGQEPDIAAKIAALGMFKGSRVPSQDDLDEIRSTLWERLGQRDG